jgi:uncharacterized membrane protein YphA (DoxX/SURF4 family)
MKRRLLLFGALLALLPSAAQAHVKWFSEFDFSHQPRTLAEVLTPVFWVLALLSMAVIAALVWIDRWLERQPWMARLTAWLTQYKPNSTNIMRIATGATLLLAWNNNALLVPELPVTVPALGWLQFVMVLLLCLQVTTPAAGAGVLALYLYGMGEYGFFHMLDYLHFVGIGVYLLLSSVEELRVRALRLPVLYATIGLALIWLALEKLVYPDWGLYVLQQNPALTFGLPPAFFLQSAAFVEISLGYLLLLGLLSRPLAVVITLVFFMTTLVFGKTEIIGHTTLHAALIVFLLNGPGTVYPPPITFHRNLPLRIAFGAVNFAVVLGVLLVIYQWSAWQQYAVESTGLLMPVLLHFP